MNDIGIYQILLFASIALNIVFVSVTYILCIEIRQHKLKNVTLQNYLDEEREKKKLANDELFKTIRNDIKFGDKNGLI